MVNKVTLIGRLGADPEVKYLPDGSPVTNFTVATSEKWTKDGEKQERTEWHKIVTFRKLAEICGQYLNKGSLVYIEGKIQTRKWQDKEGIDRYSTEIVADKMTMLGGKSEEARKPEGAPDYSKPSDYGDVPF